MRVTRYRFGDFQLDPALRELSRSGERLALPLKSLECLAYLVVNRERAVGRDELVSAVWGRADVSDTVITQTMRRARKALDDAGDRQTMIRTVAGFGYRWVAPTEAISVDVDGAAEFSTGYVSAEPAAVPAIALTTPVAFVEPKIDRAPPPARRTRWRLAAALGTLALLVVAGGVFMHVVTRPPPVRPVVADASVIVLPVTVEGGQAEFSWVRLGAMEYAADRLRAASLRVTPTEQTLHLSAATGEGGDLDALLARSGAHWLLVPVAERAGPHWRVRLRSLDGSSDTSVEAQGDTPLQAMAVATDTWLRRVHRAPVQVAAPTPLQERLQRIDAELDAGQLEAAREQILGAPPGARDEPRMLVREGQLEYRAGRMDAAQALFARGLEHQPPADPRVRAKALMGLGSVALRQSRPAEAQRSYTDALEVLAGTSTGSGDTALLGNAYNGRGVARIKLNDLEGAVSDLGMARIAMRRSGDMVSAAMVGSNLGRIEGIRNHWPQAIQEFESANAVFERFQVHDYLAATLAAESEAYLELVQPAQASTRIERAAGLLARIEDTTLIGVVRATQARVAIANGKLDTAATALKALPPAPGERSTGTLQMAVALSRGDRGNAARLAKQVPASAQAPDFNGVTIPVQAAGAALVARSWLKLSVPEQAAQSAETATDPAAAAFAAAVVERRFGSVGTALPLANEALAVADREGSPNDRVRANVLRALVLLDARQIQDATAVLGELDGYASADYRVAWLAWTLYNRRGDTDMARHAFTQVQALRGQRMLAVEPLL
jgi:DNA-binding winged helix-turn-helix (wHTH) protein/tetratricopeptide (TPR) repeat protein